MGQPKTVDDADDPARKIYPDMPNAFTTDAEFCAAVDVGLAQIEAGETIPFETVAANLRRKASGPA